MKKPKNRKKTRGDSAHICYRGTSICPLRQSTPTSTASQWVLFALSSQISFFHYDEPCREIGPAEKEALCKVPASFASPSRRPHGLRSRPTATEASRGSATG